MNFQCTIIGLLGLVPVLLTSLDAFWSIDALMPPQAPTAQLLQLLQLHLNYARTHLTSSDPQFFCVGKGQVVCYGLLWSAGLPFHCLGELFQPYEKGGHGRPHDATPTSQHTVSPHITTTSWPRRKPQSLRFSWKLWENNQSGLHWGKHGITYCKRGANVESRDWDARPLQSCTQQRGPLLTPWTFDSISIATLFGLLDEYDMILPLSFLSLMPCRPDGKQFGTQNLSSRACPAMQHAIHSMLSHEFQW